MPRISIMVAALSAVAAASFIVLPATVAGAAGSSHLWVSNVATLSTAPGTSCSSPGYATIQSAINAATSGDTIEVCAGTYTEQLTITTNLSIKALGSATLDLPTSPVNDTTTCDDAYGAAWNDYDQEAVSICGATVHLTGLNVSALWPESYQTCEGNLAGIFVGGNSDLVAKNVSVTGAGVPEDSGAFSCQYGDGIQVGTSRTSPTESAQATLKNVTVTDFQKNGIYADGSGTVVNINKATVTGYGPAENGTNGIEIKNGAKGVITKANVSQIECDEPAPSCGPDGLYNYQADAILFYGAAPGSRLTNSTVSDNDVGLYYGSESPTEPSSPEVAISHDTFTSNRYIGVQFDQGDASLNNDTINGTGNVGIQIMQYIDNAFQGSQTYTQAETATNDTISGQGAAVQVYSDNNPADFGGVFTLSHSHYLTGNTVAQENNSDNYIIGGVANS